jgi:predicted glycosyltransferase
MPVLSSKMHDLLAHADLFVGDSGTMSTEAALLGVPSVRLHTYAGTDDEPQFVDLQEDYGLMFSCADDRQAVEQALVLATTETSAETWQQRRQAVLDDYPDVTSELLALIITGETSDAVRTANAT